MALDKAMGSVERLTVDEIRSRKYLYDDQPPAEETCLFCHAKLPHEGIVYDGKVIRWMPQAKRCTCEEAIKYWEKADAAAAAKEAAERLAQERKRRIENSTRLVGDKRMSKRFSNRTFESWVMTPENMSAFRTALAYAKGFDKYAATGGGLYFEGPCGTGKTHLAAAITNALMERGVPVICKPSIELLDDLRAAFSDEQNRVMRLYKTIDLLIIDDLGKEYCTEWSQATLYSIINERYEAMRPTCITTNFGEDDLVRQLTLSGGDNSRIRAIISRLHEVNIAVPMVWADYRGHQP